LLVAVHSLLNQLFLFFLFSRLAVVSCVNERGGTEVAKEESAKKSEILKSRTKHVRCAELSVPEWELVLGAEKTR
jgi:hypothetical protein